MRCCIKIGQQTHTSTTVFIQLYRLNKFENREIIPFFFIKYQVSAKYGHCGREDLNVAWKSEDTKVNEFNELYEETKRTP